MGCRTAACTSTFLDVGQGDAIFVRTPDGRQILVDGGPSPQALFNQLGEVMPFWDRSLDLVVLTHPDADHMTGLVALSERYRVSQALDDLGPDSDPAQLKAAAPWLQAVAKPGTRRVVATPGMRVAIGRATLTVFRPGWPVPARARPAITTIHSYCGWTTAGPVFC